MSFSHLNRFIFYSIYRSDRTIHILLVRFTLQCAVILQFFFFFFYFFLLFLFVLDWCLWTLSTDNRFSYRKKKKRRTNTRPRTRERKERKIENVNRMNADTRKSMFRKSFLLFLVISFILCSFQCIFICHPLIFLFALYTSLFARIVWCGWNWWQIYWNVLCWFGHVRREE